MISGICYIIILRHCFYFRKILTFVCIYDLIFHNYNISLTMIKQKLGFSITFSLALENR